MNSDREWLEELMKNLNEQGGAETLRKELAATIEDVLIIQAPSFDPWTEPLLTFDARKLERLE